MARGLGALSRFGATLLFVCPFSVTGIEDGCLRDGGQCRKRRASLLGARKNLFGDLFSKQVIAAMGQAAACLFEHDIKVRHRPIIELFHEPSPFTPAKSFIYGIPTRREGS